MILGTRDLSNILSGRINLDNKETVNNVVGFSVKNNSRFTVMLLGEKVKESLEVACDKIIDQIADLDKKGHLVGFLGPSLNLINLSIVESMVVSYVAVTDQGMASFETGNSIF